ncbi:MAG TPA: hypothetical protein VEC06_17515 [Paucimonas sp.]|nr:hypothetical protein [Paucimonas sp.]
MNKVIAHNLAVAYRRLTLVLVLLFACLQSAWAQTAPACPTPEEYGTVEVVRVFTRGDPAAVPRVHLRNELSLEIRNLPRLLARAQCGSPRKKIVLFLDGRPVTDVTPFPPTDPSKPFLIFPLQRTEQSRETWTHLLGRPRWDPRPTPVSVGLEDEWPVESKASIQLDVIPRGWFIAWTLIFSLLVACFLALAVKSDLLRDSGREPGAGRRKPYSLARVQAAWWFFLVLASYLFIGLITGDYGTTITGTVLGLLGISAATAIGSATIDAGRSRPPGAPAAAPGAAPVAAPAAAPPPTSSYWWIDILSDAGGVSFHRFQVAAWTFVLGIIFVVQVYQVLAMPTFDESLLALLGISGGTYLGLKITEPRAD